MDDVQTANVVLDKDSGEKDLTEEWVEDQVAQETAGKGLIAFSFAIDIPLNKSPRKATTLTVRPCPSASGCRDTR